MFLTSIQRSCVRRLYRHSSTAGGSSSLADIRQARVDKLQSMRDDDVNPFKYKFTKTYTSKKLHDIYYDKLANGEEDIAQNEVAIAGRIMLRRVFGKLAFFTLQDEAGQIQLYLDKKRLGDDFKRIKEWTDAGDIVGVRGIVKKTDKGELSIHVHQWEMLTKSLNPLPDKWSGLQDVDKRYRQRHLDMIVNPSVRETLISRSKVIRSIRNILDNYWNNYYEAYYYRTKLTIGRAHVGKTRTSIASTTRSTSIKLTISTWF